jgi:sugar lactone lactonase YvrE
VSSSQRGLVFSAFIGAATLFAATACDEPDPCLSPTPEMVCTIAGTGLLGFNSDGRPANESDLYLPSTVRRGPDGRLYVMDFNNQRLRVIDEAGLLQTVAGNGWHALADTTLPAVDSPLENPIDFDFLPDGRLVFISYHDPRVLMIDDDGSLVVLAGDGEVGLRGNEGDFEDPLRARFIQLDGIVIDANGTIYVSDSLANRVRMIRDGIIQTVAGTERNGYSGDGGPGTAAQLDWPSALALTADGTLLIADTRNDVVRTLAPDGTIDTLAGTGEPGSLGDGGPAIDAQLDGPYGLAVASDGALYIADREGFRIRRIGEDGVITTVAGTGQRGFTGDGGPATLATFGYLGRIALDPDDALLVADQSNSCVRRIQLPLSMR